MLAFIRAQLPRAEVELKELAPGEQIDALYHYKLELGLFHAELKIDLIAAWRRDNTSPLLARIAREIRERSAALLTTA